jgi:hypothetical protein
MPWTPGFRPQYLRVARHVPCLPPRRLSPAAAAAEATAARRDTQPSSSPTPTPKTPPKQTFILYIKADLENIGRITCDRLATRWALTVKEAAGAEQRDVFVSATETHDLSGSKGTANFVMKFDKGSKHEAYLNVLELKGVTRDVTADDDGQMVPFVAFECRGLEPVAWRATADDVFRVESASGKGVSWDAADLSEAAGDGWAEYDDKAGEPVGISGLESEFRLHKGGK